MPERIAQYGVSAEMLKSARPEERFILLLQDAELHSIDNDQARKAELRGRRIQANQDLVNAYTDWMWVARTAADVASGAMTAYSGIQGDKTYKYMAQATGSLSPVAGQLNQQDIEEQRSLGQLADSLLRDVEGKREEILQRNNQVWGQIAEARLQASRAGA
ncbi:MAG: hypothetical protein KDK48_01750 [Chlamydiia bacterium]|nr:hypothetical protein [Chlamydiia bacterium]